MPTDSAPALPVSALVAWWGTSWLRGQVVLDLVLDAVLGQDATHVVAGLPGVDGSVPLSRALAEIRVSGASSFGLALAVPGDPVGLGGPADLTTAALECGEAVVAGAAALVPRRVGAAVEWTAYPASPRHPPDVGEADRGLRLALRDAASALAALDVARWRPEAADALLNLHHPPRLRPPAGTPPRCAELAGRSLQARAIADLALEDDGGALSAADAGRRRDALQPLARAARRGLVAACSPEAWAP
ncbi:MAG TPA: hypothetical protein VHW64_02455 [Nocardioides sp.]|uniref:hypothetical protein n=1 Tax=Nocardioides sp. TaxID=35761 RepID=UPI002E330DD5|nr:hypothetical protein [Nocardioides sp.]HEX3929538.1 hypothetical protein [Nocardioides sp.]